MNRPIYKSRLAGQDSPTLALPRECGGVEETREKWLTLAYLSNMPDEIDSETEADMPEQFPQEFLKDAQPEEGVQ